VGGRLCVGGVVRGVQAPARPGRAAPAGRGTTGRILCGPGRTARARRNKCEHRFGQEKAARGLDLVRFLRSICYHCLTNVYLAY
jgi:hypothetical protein